jgi:hypothetical protein
VGKNAKFILHPIYNVLSAKNEKMIDVLSHSPRASAFCSLLQERTSNSLIDYVKETRQGGPHGETVRTFVRRQE